jgi:5-methylcytosine-specific restriction endonuclease McrA
MPYAPFNTKCSELGCNETRSALNGFCLNHGGKQYTTRDSNNNYKTPAWKSIRRRQLSIQPLCQSCLSKGKIEAAKHVDHVFPWRQIGDQAFIHNVFQSLCPECHSYKTGKEKQGVFIMWSLDGEYRLTEHDYQAQVAAVEA